MGHAEFEGFMKKRNTSAFIGLLVCEEYKPRNRKSQGLYLWNKRGGEFLRGTKDPGG
jgi:hypothetical protein